MFNSYPYALGPCSTSDSVTRIKKSRVKRLNAQQSSLNRLNPKDLRVSQSANHVSLQILNRFPMDFLWFPSRFPRKFRVISRSKAPVAPVKGPAMTTRWFQVGAPSIKESGSQHDTTRLSARYPGCWYTYPSETYDFVSWDDDIPNWMEEKCSKPPTSIYLWHNYG
jgi:hypothetical protein